MNVICDRGFFKFYPQEPSDLMRFKRIFKTDLYRERDYYTFEKLKGLPRYSIAASEYAGNLAIKTYEGREPADVMAKNELVYSLSLSAAVPMLTITSSSTIRDGLSYATAEGSLIQPGSRLSGTLQRILSYSGWLSLDYQRLYVFERELI